MIYAYPDSQTTYAVTWADNPPVERASGDGAERTLDMARDGALARTQATLIGESSDTARRLSGARLFRPQPGRRHL